jgi:hypothetical protein
VNLSSSEKDARVRLVVEPVALVTRRHCPQLLPINAMIFCVGLRRSSERLEENVR